MFLPNYMLCEQVAVDPGNLEISEFENGHGEVGEQRENSGKCVFLSCGVLPCIVQCQKVGVNCSKSDGGLLV